MDRKDPAGIRGLSSDALGHGLTLGGSILLFLFLGNWVGKKVGAEELLTLVGAFVGAAAGFYSLYVRVVIRPRINREKKSE